MDLSLDYAGNKYSVTNVTGKCARRRVRLFFRTAAALLGLLLLVISASVVSAATTSAPKLSEKKVTLIQYETVRLKLKPVAGTVRWKTSNPEVATVTQKGRVRAVGAGKCKITARYKKKSYTCTVRVKPLALSSDAVTLVRGRQTVLAVNNEKAKPRWESSDPAIATVDETGRIQALKSGTCTITATWKEAAPTCTVRVLGISPWNLRVAYSAKKVNRGKILLAGSSSMDLWYGAPQAFAPHEVLNMAIGGTTVVQWLEWYETLIVRYKPSAVVLYVGSNDLSNGQLITGEANAANTILLLSRIKKQLKNIPIYYIGVNPCWSRQGAWEAIRTSNDLVRAYCEKKKNLYYLDVAAAFALPDGTPNPALFLSDRLHPSLAGYDIWRKVVAKPVKKEVKKREKAAKKK